MGKDFRTSARELSAGSSRPTRCARRPTNFEKGRRAQLQNTAILAVSVVGLKNWLDHFLGRIQVLFCPFAGARGPASRLRRRELKNSESGVRAKEKTDCRVLAMAKIIAAKDHGRSAHNRSSPRKAVQIATSLSSDLWSKAF
jgi:hypothetical protein